MPGTGSPSKPRPRSPASAMAPVRAIGCCRRWPQPTLAWTSARRRIWLPSLARTVASFATSTRRVSQPATGVASSPPVSRPRRWQGFLQDPESHDPSTAPDLFRPHFVLFLVFLKLLERSRAQLNSLTARHLDFYFRQYLRLQPKPSIADRERHHRAGTRRQDPALASWDAAQCGPDATGIDRIYATDRDLFVNRAQVASLRSLYIDCRRTTLRQAPLRHPNDSERICEHMFRITLADPLPPSLMVARSTSPPCARYTMRCARARARPSSPIATLRELMTRLALRPAAPAEWKEINSKLVIAGTAYRNGGAFRLRSRRKIFTETSRGGRPGQCRDAAPGGDV